MGRVAGFRGEHQDASAGALVGAGPLPSSVASDHSMVRRTYVPLSLPLTRVRLFSMAIFAASR
jgi:hypothetical protein